MRNDEIILCKCCSDEHQIVFHWWDEDIGDVVYMEVLINPEYRWWKRVIRAIKYIFGYRSKYGMFDEFILDKKDIPKLKRIIRYLEKTK